jgi:hypothetical protein
MTNTEKVKTVCVLCHYTINSDGQLGEHIEDYKFIMYGSKENESRGLCNNCLRIEKENLFSSKMLEWQ